MGEARFPLWAGLAAGGAVVLLLVAAILTFSADLSRNSDEFGSGIDDVRNANNMDIVAAFFADLGLLVLGATFIAAATLGDNAPWARVAFALGGLAALVPGFF